MTAPIRATRVLTPSEARVLILAASGQSVARIAEQLQVKRASVASMLSRVHAKTGSATVHGSLLAAERNGDVSRADLLELSIDCVTAQRDDAEQRIARALEALDAGDRMGARLALLRQHPDVCTHPPSRAAPGPAGSIRCSMCHTRTVSPDGALPALVEWTVRCSTCRMPTGMACVSTRGDRRGQAMADVHLARRRSYEQAR